MANGSPKPVIAGVLQGFAQGQQIQSQLATQQEELKLKKQELDLKKKQIEFQTRQTNPMDLFQQAMRIMQGGEQPQEDLRFPGMGGAPQEQGMESAAGVGAPSGLQFDPTININERGEPSFSLKGRQPERPLTVAPGGTLVSPTGETLFQAPTASKQPTPSYDDEQIGLKLAQELGRPPTPAEFLAEKQKMKLETTTDMPTDFTEGGIDLSAWQYLQTGVTPSMGFGARGTVAQVKVRNRAAEIAKSYGLSAQDILQGRTSVKAAQSALSGLERQAASVLSFAKTAEANLGMAETLSSKVGRTGVPVFNRAAISAERKVFGDPDVAAFHAATRVAINEFARVTTSVTGGGVTSDAARKEIEDILLTAYTPEQFSRVVSTLRAEMQNRIEGYQEGGRRIQESLFGAFAPRGSPGTPGLVGPSPQQTPLPQPAPVGGAQAPSGQPQLNQLQQSRVQGAKEGDEFELQGKRWIKRGGQLVPAGR